LDVLVKGVRIIYDQLLYVLKSHNVEQIEAKGEMFDPATHEAMTQRSEPEAEDNTVLEEFQKGYKLNGRVIRPSKVIVNKLVTEQKELPQEGQEQAEEGQNADESDESEAADRE
jgi:molecular chaperone GrpE (heat shock protein)